MGLIDFSNVNTTIFISYLLGPNYLSHRSVMILKSVCIFLIIGAALGCDETEYSCAGGAVCIPAAQKCDGTPHCPMGEDEVNCDPAKVECSEDQFKCHTLPQCVDQLFVCDGHYDCHDSSDEYYCPEIRKLHPPPPPPGPSQNKI